MEEALQVEMVDYFIRDKIQDSKSVFQATVNATGVAVAIKIIQSPSESSHRAQILERLTKLRNLRNPYVVAHKKVIEGREHAFVTME